MQASGGNHFGSETNHLATTQEPGNERMRFVSLKLRMRIDQRVAIVQTSTITEIQNPVLHSVDPTAAVGPLIGGKSERVRDPTSWITVVGKFPKLFDAKAVNLRLAPLVQAKPLNQFLRQRASHAFAQHVHLP